MSFFLTPSVKSATLESGTVSLSSTVDDGVTASVSFTETFDSGPIVVTYIPTRSGGQSIECRAKNVTNSGCDIHMEEPDNAGHATETAVWVAAEPGTHQIDGVKFEAHTHTTSTTLRSGDSGSGDSVSFSHSWSSKPTVIHNLQTYNNGAFMATVSTGVSTSAVELAQEAAQTGISSTTEDIAWMAFETVGAGTIDGNTIDVNYANDGSNDGVDNSAHDISFNASFGSTPDIAVAGHTRNGNDGWWSRGAGSQWNTSGHDVYAEEDQVGDSERGHADETFSWFAIDPNTFIKS